MWREEAAAWTEVEMNRISQKYSQPFFLYQPLFSKECNQITQFETEENCHDIKVVIHAEACWAFWNPILQRDRVSGMPYDQAFGL